jgi:DNA-binding CsgD family transcriptional regulator
VKNDAIAIVEAAYDLGTSERDWLTALLERASRRLDRGMGVAAWRYDGRQGIIPESRIWSGIDEDLKTAWIGMASVQEGKLSKRVHSIPGTFVTATENLGLTEAEAMVFPPSARLLHPVGVYDIVAVNVRDPSGDGVVLAAPMPDVRRPTVRERRPWSRIGAHIEAAARLRRALAGLPDRDPTAGAEAILSPDGAVQHAEAPAKSEAARTTLRSAARAIDRARGKARADEDEALELWQGLVAGRWSLVERFDSDGRRFLVARRNDPHVVDPRALTLRERQVLAYAAMGHRLKLIAYALGLSVPTVSNHRTRAMRKLGLTSQADLTALFAERSEPPASSAAAEPHGKPRP